MKTKKYHHKEKEKPDAFDIASQEKKKPGRPRKHPDVLETPVPVQEEHLEEDLEQTEGGDLVDMSEKEAERIVQRASDRKDEAKAKVEATVDSQDWTASDPVIPEELAGKVWVAVYRCPDAHKTKATNRQKDTGVLCWKCKAAGVKVKATIMPQFLEKPESMDPDLERRKKSHGGD